MQVDAAISQANPVSATYYPVLTATNARIIEACVNITWAVTQPTPLRMRITTALKTMIFSFTNPVTTQNYNPYVSGVFADNVGEMITSSSVDSFRRGSYLLEDISVLIEVNVTWGVTQPSPLVCRVKWAKW